MKYEPDLIDLDIQYKTYLMGESGVLHFLHCDLILPCLQIDAPPHSLHFYFCLPCSPIDAPPQSLHLDLILPCSQIDAAPGPSTPCIATFAFCARRSTQSLHFFFLPDMIIIDPREDLISTMTMDC
jgi:hypothetical protein